MTMIEDILLNFNKCAYEFYEWDKEDKIVHVKCISAIKVSDKVIKDFLNNDIKISSNLLSNIKDKTEIYKYTSSYKLKYALIVYSQKLALALKFNDDGICIGKSRMLYDEEDDVIKNTKEEIKIKYEILNKSEINTKVTRNEVKTINYLCSYLDDLYINKKYEAIKYYYLECFNNKCNINDAYNILKKSIENYENNTIIKLKKIIKSIKS